MKPDRYYMLLEPGDEILQGDVVANAFGGGLIAPTTEAVPTGPYTMPHFRPATADIADLEEQIASLTDALKQLRQACDLLVIAADDALQFPEAVPTLAPWDELSSAAKTARTVAP